VKYLLTLLLAGLLVAGGYVWLDRVNSETRVEYRTAPVQRGELLATISATGTVEPEEVVDVGAQVAGKIENLGRDPTDAEKSIDYGSLVEEGTVLAQIDDSIYRAQVNQAKANLQRAEADLMQLEAKVRQTERDWKRAQTLLPTKAIAESDYDLAQAASEVAKAALNVGHATVAQNKAALELAETNLGYTTIKSPVKGVIIDRRVNVGQTVVASLNAPSLFLIAKDLKKIQVWASVNEADIGRIRNGQPVEFTVDAYPGEAFHGVVKQRRLNASMNQNVVTYTVVVSTDNPEGLLLPYLTANLRFQMERHSDVLMVPAAALKWQPPARAIAPEASAATAEKPREKSRGPRGERSAAREPQQRLWVVDGEFVRPINVKAGITDGKNVEISGKNVDEHLEVIVGDVRRDSSTAQTNNPFAPKFFNRGGGRPKM